MKIPTIYFVVADYSKTLGCRFPVGCSDPLDRRYDAFDDFVKYTENGQDVRVFVMEFCAETNAFEAAREITEEFADNFAQIQAAADQDEPYIGYDEKRLWSGELTAEERAGFVALDTAAE